MRSRLWFSLCIYQGTVGRSCFHLAASSDGGIGVFDVVAENDTVVCLGDGSGVEVAGYVEVEYSREAMHIKFELLWGIIN